MVRFKSWLKSGWILALFLCLGPVANADGPAKLPFLRTIKGTVKKINLKSNQVVLVDKKGKERTIHLDEKTFVEVKARKNYTADDVARALDPYAFLRNPPSKKREQTICYMPGKQIRALKVGDKLAITYSQRDEKALAALITAER